jgi:cell division transport system permease protein
VKAAAAKLWYLVGDALASMRDNLATVVFTTVTIALSLAILCLFLFVFLNLNAALARFGDRAHMVAYISEPDAGRHERLRREALRMDGVKDVRYVSREEALKDLKVALKGHDAILDGIEAGALPASLEITLSEAARDPAGAASVAERLKALDWIDEVQYSSEWVDKFSSVLGFVEAAAVAIGAFLAAATVFVVSNTVRLAVYARRDEIEILGLTGASAAYIKIPFFIEGAVEGALGGGLAVAMLAGLRHFLTPRIPPYLGFVADPPVGAAGLMAMLVAAGVFMGVAGGLVSMGRFLKA